MERAVRLLRSPIFVIAAVTVLAGAIRFANLSDPRTLVFDETYYAKDACIYLGKPAETCGLETAAEQSWVHPPLGKWMIAGGEALFGATIERPDERPFGWRFSSALFGTLTVTLTAILAWVLTRSALWTAAAGILLATEHLHFVQSRMSMLDVFLAFFVVAGFLCLALDRRWIEAQEEPAEPPPEPGPWSTQSSRALSLGPGAMAAQEFDVAADARAGERRRVPSPLLRRWRFLAGMSFGAAAAVKWSGATALVAAALLSLFWEVGRRRRANRRRPLGETVLQESLGLLLAFVLAPLLVYLATYVTWLSDHGWSFTEFLGHHGNILEFHWNLEAFKDGKPTHPYQSRAWSWLLMIRPVSYFYEGGEGRSAEILGMGNPALFWGSLLAVPYTVVRWIRRRDWAAGLVAVAFLGQYLPWLPVNRPIFLFYMTPMVPFMALAATLALRGLSDVRTSTGAQPFAALAGLLFGVAVTLFVFFHPILVGTEISQDAWNARMWFRSWV